MEYHLPKIAKEKVHHRQWILLWLMFPLQLLVPVVMDMEVVASLVLEFLHRKIPLP